MVEGDILGVMEFQRPNRRLDGPTRRVVKRPDGSPAGPAPVLPPPAAPSADRVMVPVTVTPVAAPLKRPWWRPRLPWSSKRIGLAFSILLLMVVAGVGIKAVLASQRIVTKNTRSAPALQGAIDPTKLRGEGDGRINVLLLGIGGGSHEGATLSDTIMVAS